MAIHNLPDKEQVKNVVEADPSVPSGRLTYEVSRWFGLLGDLLPSKRHIFLSVKILQAASKKKIMFLYDSG